MAEWRTNSERCYLEELATADGKVKVHRRKGCRAPVESMLECTVAARDELEGEFSRGAFNDIEYDILTYVPHFGAYYIWNYNEVIINLPGPKAPELSDFLTVSYSRTLLPEEEAGRLHELYLREACGEVLEAEDELELYGLMKSVGTAWKESYGDISSKVLRELVRHESTHSLEENIKLTLSLNELKMKHLSPDEFTDQAVNEMLREGFATLVGHDYKTIIPSAVGEVFREKLEKMFRRAKTIDYEGLSPRAVIGERFRRFVRRIVTGEKIVPAVPYGKYIPGLNPSVLDFAGEYLAGTILDAFGKDAVRKCVTDLTQEEILALHFDACSSLDRVPLLDLTEYPYYKKRILPLF